MYIELYIVILIIILNLIFNKSKEYFHFQRYPFFNFRNKNRLRNRYWHRPYHYSYRSYPHYLGKHHYYKDSDLYLYKNKF